MIKNRLLIYDLAIAKLAMQIQHNEKPEFDNVFVNLGAFHMQMAYFKAIGKYIDSSGLFEILVLDSKHFNRCKRLASCLLYTSVVVVVTIFEVSHFSFFINV